MTTVSMFQRVVRGSSMKILSLVIAVATSFYLMPFLITTLGKEQYGIWILAGAFAGYYGFLDFGISSATGRFIALSLGEQDYHKANCVTTSSLVIYLFISALILIITFLLAGYFNQSENDNGHTISYLILVLGLGLAIQFPARSFGTILTGMLRYDILNGIEIFTLLIRTSLILLFLNHEYGIIALAVITSTTAIFACMLNFFFMKKIFPNYEIKLSNIDFRLMKTMFSYAWKMFLFTTSNLIKLRTIPFIVTSVTNINLLVIYSIAATFMTYFKEIIIAVTGMSYHITSRLQGENNHKQIQQVVFYATSIAAVVSTYIATSIILYGKTFIVLWMGIDFLQSYDILVILCLFEMFVFIMEPSLNAFAGLSKHSINATLNIIDLAISIPLSIILGTLYGLFGIVIAISTPQIIKILIIPYYTSKEIGVGVVSLYLKTVLPIVLATSVGCVLFFTGISVLHIPSSYFDLIVCNLIQPVCVACVVYPLLPIGLKDLIKRNVFSQITPRIVRLFV